MSRIGGDRAPEPILPKAGGNADVDRRLAPPINSEAEQSLLGSILINNAALGRVSEFLLPEHFGNGVHARIYTAIQKLVDRGDVASPVTLHQYFEHDGSLSEVGGAAYLARLAAAAV